MSSRFEGVGVVVVLVVGGMVLLMLLLLFLVEGICGVGGWMDR